MAVLAAAAVQAAALPAVPISITFKGSYVLDAHAGQPAFDPTSKNCVPQSIQKETETVRWTIRFTAPELPTRGSLSLSSNDVAISGTHLWDEMSLRCAAFPAGHLVCRTHFITLPQTMMVTFARGETTFHPGLTLDAVSSGAPCHGQVYNEHPDCGARAAAAVTDFAFFGQLRLIAPHLGGTEAQAPFDVQRTRSCAHAGVRNPGTIRQTVTVRYQGIVALEHG